MPPVNIAIIAEWQEKANRAIGRKIFRVISTWMWYYDKVMMVEDLPFSVGKNSSKANI